MSDNPSETENVNLMYPDMDAELEEETTEELEGDETVEDDEESGEDVNEDDSGDDESETIEFNGREISADELEQMDQAFSDRKNFQADYTRKTTAMANQMKLVQAETDKQMKITESLEETLSSLQSDLDSEEQAIDWDELADDDPAAALKLERKFKARKKEVEATKVKVESAKQQASEAKIAEQNSLLNELIPEWFDGSQPSKLQSEEYRVIGEYLLGKGFTAQDITDISTTKISAKDWPIYRDAAKYAALQKKKPGTKKLVKTKPKSIKGGKTLRGSKNPAWDKVFYGDSMK